MKQQQGYRNWRSLQQEITFFFFIINILVVVEKIAI